MKIFPQTDMNDASYNAKRLVVQAGFFALGRALQSTSRFEADVQREVQRWNDGYSFSMNVLPKGPSFSMQKEGDHLVYLGNNAKPDADLIVEIKNLDTAFRMISTQAGIHHVYAEHKISVTGNVADSMALIRMIYIVESYLFPGMLGKNVLKQPPQMTMQKHINRLKIFTKGIVLGK